MANAGLTAQASGAWFGSLVQPPGAPPAWLLAPLWTALYVSIGISAWLLWRRVELAAHRKRAALTLWGWQLLANAAWPALFFGLHSPRLGLAGIALLLALIAATIAAFRRLHRPAALLLLPYLTWVLYAAYLSAALVALNAP